MKFTSREIFGVFLVLIVALLSLAAWRSFFDTSLRPDVTNTLLATLWFSLLGSFFFLGTVVWRDKLLQISGSIFLFLPSFLFTQTLLHVGIVLLSGVFVYLSMGIVQREMKERIRFRFVKNVRAGAFTFVFGLSLALSSAYFASIRSESWEELVPRIMVGEGTASVIFKTAGYFYPEYQKISEEGMTVDGFLESLQDENEQTMTPEIETERKVYNTDEAISSLPELTEYLRRYAEEYGNITEDELAHELYLRSGRAQISELAGKQLYGDEKIADVFSLAIQRRIIAALSAREATQHLSPTILPVFLTLLLFITLLPIGSLLSILWAFIGFILFSIALYFHGIRKIKVQKDQEVLEE